MTRGPVPALAAPGRPPATKLRAPAVQRGWGWRARLQIGATSALLLAAAAGVPLTGGPVTLAACAALLLFGLPHGSFDILLIAGARRRGWSGPAAALLLYGILAAAMAVLWWTLPGVALAAFLLIGVMHFAEDWHSARSTFVAQGVALALLATPALLHRADLAALLSLVASPPAGVLTTAALVTVAPVAVAVALVGFVVIARSGQRSLAVSGVIALAGMVALPPLAGFALFFCLLHSPLHFAEARLEHGRDGWRRWAPVVIPITVLALGVAGAAYWFGAAGSVPATLVRASFRTLSILTVPHVVVPALLRRPWRPALPPAAREGRG